jgi:hypothetical protein
MFSNFMSRKKTQVFQFNCKFLKFKLYVCCFPVSMLSFSVFLYVFTFNIDYRVNNVLLKLIFYIKSINVF